MFARTQKVKMAYTSDDFLFELCSVIRDHHVYKSAWSSCIGELFRLMLKMNMMFMLWELLKTPSLATLLGRCQDFHFFL